MQFARLKSSQPLEGLRSPVIDRPTEVAHGHDDRPRGRTEKNPMGHNGQRNANWARGRIFWHGSSVGRNLALPHVVLEEKFATCVLTNIDGEGVHAACDEVNLFLVEKFRAGLLTEGGLKAKTKQSSGGKGARRP
jgi:hypothetical protein